MPADVLGGVEGGAALARAPDVALGDEVRESQPALRAQQQRALPIEQGNSLVRSWAARLRCPSRMHTSARSSLDSPLLDEVVGPVGKRDGLSRESDALTRVAGRCQGATRDPPRPDLGREITGDTHDARLLGERGGGFWIPPSHGSLGKSCEEVRPPHPS